MFKRISVGRVCATVLLCVISLLHVFSVFPIPVISQLELAIYDQKLINDLSEDVDKHVAIANIDEKSIQELGRWPWRRDKIANMVTTLFDHYEIKALGFDMVFAEASDGTAQEVLDILAQTDLQSQETFKKAYQLLTPQLDFDAIFTRSLENRNVVLGIVFNKDTQTNVNQLPLPILSLPEDIATGNALKIWQAGSYIANLPQFHQYGFPGFFDNPLVDEDGVFRKVPLIQHIQGHVYPSLALSLARLATNSEKLVVNLDDYHQVESIMLNDYPIPVGAQGEVLVPYRGKQGSFEYFSIIDILKQEVPKDALRGKAILVGTDAAALLDLRTTPFSKAFPGVEVHANIVSGLINQNIKRVPEYKLQFDVLSVLFCSAFIFFIVALKDPRWQLLGVVILLAGIVGVHHVMWHNGFVMPIGASLVLTATLFILLTLINVIVETRHKMSIVKQFGLYVPRELVNEMSKNPDKYKLENTNKEITVLFSDIRSFTSISENLSPNELSELMNRYLTEMTRVIHEHGGTIDKYMGDAIMAFWGAPVSNERHAIKAAEASLAMFTALDGLNEEFSKRGWPEIKIGVGLNTEDMFVGNMGSEFRMAYTVMGDAVNLGSRLESLTKQYGVECLIGPKTAEYLKDSMFHPMKVDFVQVKGKNEPVSIFQLDSNGKPELNQVFEDFIQCYRQRDWESALEKLGRFRQEQWVNQVLLAMYEQRIKHYQHSPPPDNWDGVYVHTQK